MASSETYLRQPSSLQNYLSGLMQDHPSAFTYTQKIEVTEKAEVIDDPTTMNMVKTSLLQAVQNIIRQSNIPDREKIADNLVNITRRS